MISPKNDYAYTFSDCGVIPDPTSQQLCSIAYDASNLHRLLSDEEPVVAFLSFSSKGSAEHYKVSKVQNAYNLFSKKYTYIKSDGEIQFDAAINSSISKRKKSTLNGESNVFIFPDLDSANIAYKVTEHLAGFQALGPLIQGLCKPVHDLSRGCKVDDIVSVSAIAALQKTIYNK
jgi:phosphotransacetylase